MLSAAQPEAPTVSAIVAAYNYEPYIAAALDSALAQDYPAERLEVVVVDDGSSDSTPEILADYTARYPGRVRCYRQENAGYIAATNRAFAEARGDFLAILDADDVWLEHKTRAQVELLAGRPEVGLVYGEMTLVDGDDRVIGESIFQHHRFTPVRGHAFPLLMRENRATASSIMVRASLRPYFDPIPAAVPYADWWLAARASIASEIDYLGDSCALYRMHGANLTGGAQGPQLVRELQKALAQQRWLLACVHLRQGLSPQELSAAFVTLHQTAATIINLARTPFPPLVEVTPEDRRRSGELLESGIAARSAGDSQLAVYHFARAFALDPWNTAASAAFQEVQAVASMPPDPLGEAREFRVLAFASELVDSPQLLAGYAAAFSALDGATLVIYARERDAQRDAQLAAQLAAVGMDSPNGAHHVRLDAMAGDRREDTIAAGIHAILSRTQDADFHAPHFSDPSELSGFAGRYLRSRLQVAA